MGQEGGHLATPALYLRPQRSVVYIHRAYYSARLGYSYFFLAAYIYDMMGRSGDQRLEYVNCHIYSEHGGQKHAVQKTSWCRIFCRILYLLQLDENEVLLKIDWCNNQAVLSITALQQKVVLFVLTAASKCRNGWTINLSKSLETRQHFARNHSSSLTRKKSQKD